MDPTSARAPVSTNHKKKMIALILNSTWKALLYETAKLFQSIKRRPITPSEELKFLRGGPSILVILCFTASFTPAESSIKIEKKSIVVFVSSACTKSSLIFLSCKISAPQLLRIRRWKETPSWLMYLLLVFFVAR